MAMPKPPQAKKILKHLKKDMAESRMSINEDKALAMQIKGNPMKKESKAKEAYEHEAAAGRAYNKSEKHKKAMSKGMKKGHKKGR